MTRPRIVGMPWFERQAYVRVRAAMDDAARLPDGYDAWLLSAEQIESELRRSGLEVVRIPIDDTEFLAWCDREDVRPTSSSRARYAGKGL